MSAVSASVSTRPSRRVFKIWLPRGEPGTRRFRRGESIIVLFAAGAAYGCGWFATRVRLASSRATAASADDLLRVLVVPGT